MWILFQYMEKSRRFFSGAEFRRTLIAVGSGHPYRRITKTEWQTGRAKVVRRRSALNPSCRPGRVPGAPAQWAVKWPSGALPSSRPR